LCFDVTELEEAKKASEAAAAATAAAQQLLQQNQQLGTSQSTPDYAVGLTALNPPTPAPATPSYSPATPQHPVTTIIAIPRDAAGESHSVDCMSDSRVWEIFTTIFTGMQDKVFF